MIEGKLQMGYSDKFLGLKVYKRKIETRKANPLVVGWKEMVLGTTGNSDLYVRTIRLTSCYVLSESRFKAILKQGISQE